MSNSYEDKQAARKARYQELAENASKKSSDVFNQAHEMASAIPLGQPIHVGHYSENRDRRYRAGIQSKYEKSFELQKTSEYFQAKAKSVGRGGISSDDPDAVLKLKKELESAKASQELMKAVNKAIRSGKTEEERIKLIVALGFAEEKAKELLKPDYCNRIGFPNYSLSNNNANIHRLEHRISELSAKQEKSDVEEQGKGYIYREDVAENRVMFIFDGKPTEEVRAILKRHAFKWSPSRGAWVRQMTNNALWYAKDVRKALDLIED